MLPASREGAFLGSNHLQVRGADDRMIVMWSELVLYGVLKAGCTGVDQSLVTKMRTWPPTLEAVVVDIFAKKSREGENLLKPPLSTVTTKKAELIDNIQVERSRAVSKNRFNQYPPLMG